MKSFKTINTDDRVLSAVQSNVDAAISPLLTNPTLDRHLIKNVSLTTGAPNLINHGLSRKLVGYSIMLKGNANVWDAQSSNKNAEKTLVLYCSANVLVDIEVF